MSSTTMNMITGCLAATSGQILIDGYDIFEDAQEAKKRIGYLPAGGDLISSLSLFDRLDDFVYGLFDLNSILFYLSTIVFFIFLTIQSMEKRRWS